MHALLRRLAIRILRDELEEREVAARRLAEGAYHDRSNRQGRAGRAWWDGYAHGVRAVREEDGAL